MLFLLISATMQIHVLMTLAEMRDVCIRSCVHVRVREIDRAQLRTIDLERIEFAGTARAFIQSSNFEVLKCYGRSLST